MNYIKGWYSDLVCFAFVSKNLKKKNFHMIIQNRVYMRIHQTDLNRMNNLIYFQIQQAVVVFVLDHTKQKRIR